MGSPLPLPVVLAPLTVGERVAFTSALVVDYVDFLVGRGEVTNRGAALARARAEIEADVEAGALAGDEFWVAHTVEGETVGWLWVKSSAEGLPPSAASLYQLLVKPEIRRQGYGTAMLAALEHVLAMVGRNELHLNVYDSNEAAGGLYERAGYQLVERLAGKRHLQKRLLPADPIRHHGGRKAAA